MGSPLKVAKTKIRAGDEEEEEVEEPRPQAPDVAARVGAVGRVLEEGPLREDPPGVVEQRGEEGGGEEEVPFLSEGRPTDPTLGPKRVSKWMALRTKMSISLHLVSAKYACSEGWEARALTFVLARLTSFSRAD